MDNARDEISEAIQHRLKSFAASLKLPTVQPISLGENCLAERPASFNNAWLSFGLPNCRFISSTIAHRIWWFPRGMPPGKSIAVACSRIGNRPDEKKYIFDALRTLLMRSSRDQNFLIHHLGTAVSPYAVRAGTWFDCNTLDLRPVSPTKSPNDIVAESKPDRNHDTTRVWPAYYWPAVAGEPAQLSDQLPMLIAQQLHLLSVRSGGNIEQISQLRLSGTQPQSYTYFLQNKLAVKPKIASSLQKAGALPWLLYETSTDSTETENSSPSNLRPSKVFSLSEFVEKNSLSEFFAHWTRSRIGPWPDQSNLAHIDQIILGSASADHGKYAALTRILASERLIATNVLTRCSTPVVCFTERTIDSFQQRRIFRPHLSRWDFETVGVAIRKRCLLPQIKKVIYGDECKWEQLAESQRPYYQVSCSGDIDWTQEQEWRIEGNVRLSHFSQTEMFVFVDCPAAAQSIAAISKWPVVLLDHSV